MQIEPYPNKKAERLEVKPEKGKYGQSSFLRRMGEAVIGIAGLLFLLGHASAATLVVTKSADAGAGSLRDTLAAAATITPASSK